MILTPSKPRASRASRIAPTRPSIMSEGAMMSQPASAWTSAWRVRISTVSSLPTSPLRSTPSWPCVVKGSSATSQSTPRSGCAALTARTARQTRFSGFVASSPSGDLRSSGVTGKNATQGMPRLFASPAASTSAGIESRSTPGMEATGARAARSSCTKTGQMKSPGVSTCSATIRRVQSSRRLRRMRTRGKVPSGRDLVEVTAPSELFWLAIINSASRAGKSECSAKRQVNPACGLDVDNAPALGLWREAQPVKMTASFAAAPAWAPIDRSSRMSRLTLRSGIFLAPFHPIDEDPTLALQRDLELIEHLDRLGYEEAWIGEHHSAGSEIIASPEIFIATAAERTRHIRLGTGVTSLAYHNPLWVAERMVLLDHLTRGRAMLGV